MKEILADFGNIDTNGKWETVEFKCHVKRKWYEFWKPKVTTFILKMNVKTAINICNTQVEESKNDDINNFTEEEL